MIPQNNNYMEDLYFYNQNPQYNPTYYPNRNLDNNFYNPNNNYSPNVYNNQFIDYNNFYPSIYKIIKPVITRVIQTSNYRYLNEEVINNMADTVYNIVEGDLEIATTITESSNTSAQNMNNSVNSYKTTENKSQNVANNSQNRMTTDDLLKDIIKILIIKELISMNQNQIRPNQNINYFNNPYMM